METMRNFSARETKWLQELDGIELAGFRQRACAFILDWILIYLVTLPIMLGGTLLYLKTLEARAGHTLDTNVNFDLRPFKYHASSSDAELEKRLDEEWIHLAYEIGVPVLYFGFFTWNGKGRTPGKRLMKIRVVSIAHPHLTLWHSIERALGYGAAALEGGFGFVQFFIHPYRRCAQDRLAETIVVTEGGFQQLHAPAAEEHSSESMA
jgi:uncharacterized RDD family membrane protein YckC